MSGESLEVDVVIVGAGPAGLSAAIRLGLHNQTRAAPLSVLVLEKGSAVGSHLLSGAVLETRALDELLPDWLERGAPVTVPVTSDHFYWLTAHKKIPLPTPSALKNPHNYVISLGKLAQWLAHQAENVGVSIFPGFAVTDAIYDAHGHVIGVKTGDKGRDKTGKPTTRFQAGMTIYAKQVIVAEGCRGSLAEKLIHQFQLRAPNNFQTYGLGIKELWRISKEKHQLGKVIHTVGWPLTHRAYGGSFIYHDENDTIALGLVVGLDYRNPTLDPFQEFQRFKTHPLVRDLLAGGECIAYGARALNEGGWQAIPTLAFPGGVLVGCSAGFLNVAKIKGIHTAMKSGMLAADVIHATTLTPGQTVTTYQHAVHTSSIAKELYRARNVRPAFHGGLCLGLLYSGIDQWLFRGKAPWTFHYRKPDHATLTPIQKTRRLHYLPPDRTYTFDTSTSVYLSGTRHCEDEPSHLILKDPSRAIAINFVQYGSPEQYYCPAAVYEIVHINGKPELQIHASNCIHCKTCDIKDPTQNILWTVPEGGDGPHYIHM